MRLSSEVPSAVGGQRKVATPNFRPGLRGIQAANSVTPESIQTRSSSELPVCVETELLAKERALRLRAEHEVGALRAELASTKAALVASEARQIQAIRKLSGGVEVQSPCQARLIAAGSPVHSRHVSPARHLSPGR
eukprot:TRINITY_DN20934_c0_g1_i2.p2 TRINITY_DN20934_c0_g1~~TRINITY_DN20934_c0_g1_i2.p2  ORF type:complete len:136 (-),score=26.69 TRINITY_DN20934_c0_g1_i2:73-480(-)